MTFLIVLLLLMIIAGSGAAAWYLLRQRELSRRRELSRFWIRALSGSLEGKRFPIKGEQRLGRDGGRCTVVFPAAAQAVSPLHCKLVAHEKELLLEDCLSAGGTYLNGWRLDPFVPMKLKNGDSFTLSQSQERFCVEVFFDD